MKIGPLGYRLIIYDDDFTRSPLVYIFLLIFIDNFTNKESLQVGLPFTIFVLGSGQTRIL